MSDMHSDGFYEGGSGSSLTSLGVIVITCKSDKFGPINMSDTGYACILARNDRVICGPNRNQCLRVERRGLGF